MQKINAVTIKSAIRNYQIQFGLQNFDIDFQKPGHFYLIDKTVFKICNFEANSSAQMILDANENIKNISTVEKLIEKMADIGLSKDSTLVVIGGGVTQDIGTLAASLYMRGINWIFVPTTLQAMADSAIGGKSSINIREKKNLVGNFYPPTNIYIDVKFLKTLKDKDILCGIIEGIKILYASGSNSFRECLDIAEKLTSQSQEVDWQTFINMSLHAKKEIIENDEFDSNDRKKLNFGHTFGHIIESLTEYKLPHGIAVGLGMLTSGHLVMDEENSDFNDLRTFLRNSLQPYTKEIQKLLGTIDFKQFQIRLSQDKKNTSSQYCFVVPGSSGLKLHFLPRSSESEALVFRALSSALSEVRRQS